MSALFGSLVTLRWLTAPVPVVATFRVKPAISLQSGTPSWSVSVVGVTVHAPDGLVTGPISGAVVEAEPASFWAVTTTCNDSPVSALVAVYEAAVAPPMLDQPPEEVERCHW